VLAEMEKGFPAATIPKWLGRGRYFNVEVTTDPSEIKADRMWLRP
jgi:hypothetical protein